jgi:hypothetical protein
MIVPNRKTFLPIFAWTLVAVALFLASLHQQRTGTEWVPALTLKNAFGWIASLLLLYLVLVWPIKLEALLQRLSLQPLSQGTYSLLALQEPGLLLLYILPVLVASAAFGFRGFAEIVQTVVIIFMVVVTILATFRLGFYFHGSMARVHYLGAGLLCALVPAVNTVYAALYGHGPAWANHLNPFYTLFHVAASDAEGGGSILTFLAVFAGLSLFLFLVPFLLAGPPRAYEDLPGLGRGA